MVEFPRTALHYEGRFAVVTKRGAGCGGRGCALTNGADRGRKRRVVLAPRRWCQVREGKLSRVTVAKEPEHRGERAHNP